MLCVPSLFLSPGWHQWIRGLLQHHCTSLSTFPSSCQRRASSSFSPLIGDAGRPSRRDSSGAFPIRVFRRKWSSFPFSSIGPSRCQSVPPHGDRSPPLSGSLCLVSPPSYWLREAAATTAEKEDPQHDEERAFAALEHFSLLKTFE